MKPSPASLPPHHSRFRRHLLRLLDGLKCPVCLHSLLSSSRTTLNDWNLFPALPTSCPRSAGVVYDQPAEESPEPCTSKVSHPRADSPQQTDLRGWPAHYHPPPPPAGASRDAGLAETLFPPPREDISPAPHPPTPGFRSERCPPHSSAPRPAAWALPGAATSPVPGPDCSRAGRSLSRPRAP